MHLLDITSNRKNSFNKISVELFNSFGQYIEKRLGLFINYFFFFYKISRNVIKKKIKRRIGILFNNQKGVHNNSLQLRFLPKYFFLYIGMLFYILIFSKIYPKKKIYELIIYDIHSQDELIRINKLIEYFGKDKVFIFFNNKKINLSNSHGELNENFKNYNLKIVLKTILFEFLIGIPIYFLLSIYYRINLFPFVIRIINNYLKYSSNFNEYKSNYLYMERHIKIDPLMREIYHKCGGKYLFATQKSILAGDQTSLCYNFDIFFSLGNKSHLRARSYDSDISKVIPIGSLFYHQRMVNDVKSQINSINSHEYKKYDLLYVGGNIMNFYELYDHYDNFMNDYYESIRWLTQIKKKYPKLRIGIKHHPSAGIDRFERDIIRESGVELIDKQLESYKLVEDSKVCVTYASTLGYESFLFKKCCLFLDPNNNNNFIAYDGESEIVDKYRVSNFNEFDMKINLILSNNKDFLSYEKEFLDDIIIYKEDPYKIIFNTLKDIK